MFATIIAGTALVRWCVDGVLLCTWRGGGGGVVALHRCVVMAPAMYSPVLFRISWFPFQSSSRPIDRERNIIVFFLPTANFVIAANPDQ